MPAKYRLPVISGQNWLTQQSHGLFAAAKLLVLDSIMTQQSKVKAEKVYDLSKFASCSKKINVLKNKRAPVILEHITVNVFNVYT